MAKSPSGQPGAFSILSAHLKSRTHVAEAVTVCLAAPRAPDRARIWSAYERFAATQAGGAAEILDKFLFLLDDGLQQRQVKLDPLVAYTLRCDLAKRLGMPID